MTSCTSFLVMGVSFTLTAWTTARSAFMSCLSRKAPKAFYDGYAEGLSTFVFFGDKPAICTHCSHFLGARAFSV